MSWYKKSKDETSGWTEKEFEKEFGSYMKPVESECISEVGYYEPLGILEVRFKRSGQKYTHKDVPKKVYEDFMDAKSKGEFYNRVIKTRYKSEKE